MELDEFQRAINEIQRRRMAAAKGWSKSARKMMVALIRAKQAGAIPGCK